MRKKPLPKKTVLLPSSITGPLVHTYKGFELREENIPRIVAYLETFIKL